MAQAAPLLCPTTIVLSSNPISFCMKGTQILSRQRFGSGKSFSTTSTLGFFRISSANQEYQFDRATGEHPIPGIRIIFILMPTSVYSLDMKHLKEYLIQHKMPSGSDPVHVTPVYCSLKFLHSSRIFILLAFA
jgi:hypothetical protein